MTHKGTVTLETPRLILRRFVPEDIKAMFYNCWQDYEVWKWTNYPPMHCLEDVTENAGLFTERWMAAYENPDRYSWAMVLKATGEPIGRIFGMHPDDRIGQVELTYEMGSAWWNQGLMTEAVDAVIAFFFDEVGFNRVHAWHVPGNPASGRVMQKCGMTYEGTLRQAGRSNRDGIADMICYAILAEEYQTHMGVSDEKGGRMR